MFRDGDGRWFQPEQPPAGLVVFHEYMYKVPFILQLNFKYIKKGRKKIKVTFV